MGIEKKHIALIVIIGIILFVPFLGNVHLFDWDEINFAEAAREMIVSGDYMNVRIDFTPFYEKPPLFFWMQALSMHVFGINEFAARFPNAIIGIISLVFIFAIGSRIRDKRLGWLWILTYIGSFLPHFYFKSGLIDPSFNLFIFAGIFVLSEYFRKLKSESQSAKYLYLAGAMISLAILTKGPVGYLIPFLTLLIFWLVNRKELRFPLKVILIFTLVSFLLPVLWYLITLSRVGWGLFSEFILYQIRLLTTSDAGHGGPFYYHAVVLLIGCFPASIFIFGSVRKSPQETEQSTNFRQWSWILFLVVLVLFSIVKTKIVHYSSLAYFPLTYLSASFLYDVIFNKRKWNRASTILITVFGLVWGILLTLLPLLLQNSKALIPHIKDKFTAALLATQVNWTGTEHLIGLVYLIAIILALFFIIRQSYLKSIVLLFGATVMVMLSFLPLIAPRIEPFLQGAPIDFYRNLKTQDCYVDVLGFKSYAHYFYSERSLRNSPFGKKMDKDVFEKWLIEGNIDKPAYFVTKNVKLEDYKNHKDLNILYRKNGYVFLVRYPKTEKN